MLGDIGIAVVKTGECLDSLKIIIGVDAKDVFFKGASGPDMNELIPEIGIFERIEDVDKPLGRFRMAGRHFVLQEYIVVKKTDFFHFVIKCRRQYLYLSFRLVRSPQAPRRGENLSEGQPTNSLL